MVMFRSVTLDFTYSPLTRVLSILYVGTWLVLKELDEDLSLCLSVSVVFRDQGIPRHVFPLQRCPSYAVPSSAWGFR